jgi:hypothetical protein
VRDTVIEAAAQTGSNDSQSGGKRTGRRSVRRCRIASTRSRWAWVTKAIGLKSIDARCSRLFGLGNRSAKCTILIGSTNRWSPALSTTHRQGWLLCNDGARHANCTAALTTSTSLRVSTIWRQGHWSSRAATLSTVKGSEETLARFHAEAGRGQAIDAHATVDAIATRWQENPSELRRFAGTVVSAEPIQEIHRLAPQFLSGRSLLFAQRIADRRIVDGHADLLADDIFCLSDGPALDCPEFDDHLRFVDGI